MRIFDVNNVEIKNPDLSRGYFKKDKVFVKHHEAVEPVEEQWHYEVIAEYPNGGKDIRKVIDVVDVKRKMHGMNTKIFIDILNIQKMNWLMNQTSRL